MPKPRALTTHPFKERMIENSLFKFIHVFIMLGLQPGAARKLSGGRPVSLVQILITGYFNIATFLFYPINFRD